MKEEFISQPHKPKKDTELTRREFLKFTLKNALGALGVILWEKSKSSEAREEQIDTLDDLYYLSKEETVDFSEIKDYPQEVKKTLEIFSSFYSELLQLLKEGNESYLSRLKTRYWWQFKKLTHFESYFSEKFSEKEFDKFVLYHLPRYFAKYGLFLKFINTPVFDKETEQLVANAYIFDIYEVRKKNEWKNIDLWGKPIECQKLFLKRKPLFDNRGKTLMIGQETSSQSFFGNIVYYEDELYQSFLERNIVLSQLEDSFPQFMKIEFEDVRDFINTEEEALQFSQVKSSWRWGEKIKTVTLETYTDMVMANLDFHEATHLQDAKDKTFLESFPFSPTSSLSEYLRSTINRSVHEEINGFLAEIRYGREKTFALSTLFSAAIQKENWRYQRAARWIIDRMVEEIIKEPLLYGFQLNKEGKIEKIDILGRLYRLDLQPFVLEQIAEKLHSLHLKRYELDDFGKEFLATQEIGKWRWLPKSELIKYALPVVLLGGTLYHILKRYFERREKVLKERMKRKERAKRKKKKEKRKVNNWLMRYSRRY